MMNANSYLGTTPPVSFNPPSSYEVSLNDDLISYLRGCSIFETDGGQHARELALAELKSIVIEWVIGVSTKKQICSKSLSTGDGVRLMVYGSQRLGVHSPSADIDVLCISPEYVSREDFFSSFCERLRLHRDVTVVLPIPEAYTPVIKFCLRDQSIDMIFVSLPLPSIPEDFNILNINVLKGLDEKGVRCLNGCRVAERLLQLIPNEDVFCISLRTIKLWARQRGIYSNVLGFLGGVNYALLVAFICQRYVSANPATIVWKFFQVLSHWRWPNPIMVSNPEDGSKLIETGGKYSSWNPKLNVKDGTHILPILTPCFPVMNSAYNVGVAQFRTIQREIQRGFSLFSGYQAQCVHQQVQASVQRIPIESIPRPPFPWDILCAPATAEFFSSHSRYLQVDITADTQMKQRVWFGWCESRLRLLLVSLDQPPNSVCHPFANCFHRILRKGEGRGGHAVGVSVALDTPQRYSRSGSGDDDILYTSSFFVGLSFSSSAVNVDLSPSIEEFLYRVNSWNSKAPGMNIHISSCRPNEVPSFVFEMTAEPSSLSGCTPAKPVRQAAVLLNSASSARKLMELSSSGRKIPLQMTQRGSSTPHTHEEDESGASHLADLLGRSQLGISSRGSFDDSNTPSRYLHDAHAQK